MCRSTNWHWTVEGVLSSCKSTEANLKVGHWTILSCEYFRKRQVIENKLINQTSITWPMVSVSSHSTLLNEGALYSDEWQDCRETFLVSVEKQKGYSFYVKHTGHKDGRRVFVIDELVGRLCGVINVRFGIGRVAISQEFGSNRCRHPPNNSHQPQGRHGRRLQSTKK